MKKLLLIPLALLTLGVVAATDIWDVKDEIRDYQKRGACFKADVSFDGKVDAIDIRFYQGDPEMGIGGFAGYNVPPAPFWLDQDKDGVIWILDIAAVASKNGKRC